MNLKYIVKLFIICIPVLLQANGENEKLIRAATEGDLSSLVSALENGADAKDQALLEAVKSRKFEVVETLLANGADPRADDHAAIYYAIEEDHTEEEDHNEIANLLLKAMHARNSSQYLTTIDSKPSRRIDALLLADK